MRHTQGHLARRSSPTAVCAHLGIVVLLASVSLTDTAVAKTFIDYLKPAPITCSPLSSATWGVAGVLPRDTCNGIESAKGAGVPPDYYYWDGKIIRAADGTFHLFMSTWPGSAGFNPGWTNSESYHAVSTQGVLGPYTRKGYIWSSGSHKGHNTTALELPDGNYAVVVSEVVPFTIYQSSSLDGPWTACTAVIQTNGVNAGSDGHYDSNVSLTARHDGKYQIVQRHGLIAIADTLCGPYRMQKPTWNYPTANRPSIDSIYPHRTSMPDPAITNPTYTWEEDPHIWYSGGRYHVLYSGSGDRIGFHLSSPDGIHDWIDGGLAFDPRMYDKIFGYEGSTTYTKWYKMERPSVVLQNGHVTHVTWSVADVDKDNQIPAGSNHGSKIILVPFDGVAFDADNGSGGTGGASAGGASAGGASAGGASAGGASAGGAKSTAGTSNAAGAKSTAGTSNTAGSSSIGGTKASGGAPTAVGTKSTGGLSSLGGSRAAGGGPTFTDVTGGNATAGGAVQSSNGGQAAAPNTTSGAFGSTGGSSVGSQSLAALGGMPASNGIVGAGGSATSTFPTDRAVSDPSGCGCRVAGGDASSKSLVAVGLLGLLMLRPRRRRAGRN